MDGPIPLAKTPPSLVNNLSRMIEIWMKINLTSDYNCNTMNFIIPQNSKGMTDNVRSTISVGDTT